MCRNLVSSFLCCNLVYTIWYLFVICNMNYYFVDPLYVLVIFFFSLNFLMFCHPDSLMYCTWTQEKWRKKNSKIEKDKTTQVFYLTMNIVWSEKGMDIISVVLSVFLWAVTALQILHVNLIQILKVAIMQIQLDECSVEWASGVAECDYPLLSNKIGRASCRERV